ncbi:ABC transporter substrate-binding protein [Geomicrobium sp. JCM 19039]|uniref:ABC transporter substrate-binding protein n=1 Tax=Geomicrobium sp. JCM 19039 TaxID=1460636 RepID=UPI00045F30B2|nr:extracellular solute-binding protein [Geomicrobium sp. JCM 19039]GAK10518.1 N-acetyl-D-glucosamine ABC transport system, sugar-binding protein [Geomicrobium sp. JCM 19039]
MHKRWMRKVGMVGAVAALTLAACNGEEDAGSGDDATGNGESSSSGDADTLRVALIGGYEMSSTTDPITGETVEGLEVIKDEFESQNPDIEVEFIVMPWSNHVANTQAMMSSGEADIYQMPGINDFAAQGMLEPLQPLIDEDGFDLDVYIDNQVEGWLTQGPDDDDLAIYGLPAFGDSRFVAYDGQLFEEWGVEPLSDYPDMEEILEKAEQMTGENPVTGEQNYGAWFSGEHSTLFQLVNAAEGQNRQWGEGYEWSEIEFAFNSDEMVTGLEWLVDINEFTPDGNMSAQGNEQWMTENNNIAIRLHAESAEIIQQVQAQGLEDRIHVVQEFKNDEGIGGMFAGSPLSIAADSENQDIAFEFLKFTASDFFQEFMWEQHSGVPVVEAASDWASIQELELMEGVLEAAANPWTPRYPWSSSQPRYILQTAVEDALTGGTDAEDALENAQAESEQWLEDR